MKSFWRWTGTIFFALAFVFLVLTAIGTSLPIDHHAVCSTSFQTRQTTLFAAVDHDDASVQWRPENKRAVLVSGRGPTAVWRETDSHGGEMTYRTTAYEYGNLLARTIDYVPGMPFAGTWSYDFSPEKLPEIISHGATTLSITEDGRIYNPFFRFLARYVFGYTQKMVTFLEDLGTLTHEKPRIVCSANGQIVTNER